MPNTYIIDPSNARSATCGLMPGKHYFKARRVKNGPLLPVMTEVVEPRDKSGALIGDVVYRVVIDGRDVPFAEWEHTSLFGEEIDEVAYRTFIADSAYTLATCGARAGEKVKMRELPAKLFEPPV